MTIKEYYVKHLKELETKPCTRGKVFDIYADGKYLAFGTFEQLLYDYGDKEIIKIAGSRIDIEWKIKTEYPDC